MEETVAVNSYPPIPDLITPYEVCEKLKISEPTLRRLRHEGKIRAYRLGGRVIRYSAADVREMLEALQIEPAKKGRGRPRKYD